MSPSPGWLRGAVSPAARGVMRGRAPGARLAAKHGSAAAPRALEGGSILSASCAPAYRDLKLLV